MSNSQSMGYLFTIQELHDRIRVLESELKLKDMKIEEFMLETEIKEKDKSIYEPIVKKWVIDHGKNIK